MAGQGDARYREFFAICRRVISPQSDSRRLITTTIHFGKVFVSPQDAAKSPWEFPWNSDRFHYAWLVRGFGELVPTTHLGQDLAALGQNLYHPPSIQGWQGGQSWINKATLLGRANLAMAMLAGGETYGNKLDPAALAKKRGLAPGHELDDWLSAEREVDARITALAPRL